ncbi:MAG: MFS transporter [Oscillibacter sp.]|nr:MFS transporter [Oscillibacter sp.]
MQNRLFTRNFTLLLLGQVFSLLGNGALRFALSMYVLEKTGSAAVFGTLLAVSMIPTILLTPFGGVLADRVNRGKVMVGLDLASGTAVLISAAAFADSRGIAVTAALMIVLSVLGAFESPTVQACVPQMLSGENVLRGNAAVNQANAISGLVTPFLGSLLYVTFGVRPVLAGAGVCFLLTALLECFIRLPQIASGKKQGLGEIIREDLLGSARFLARERREVLHLLLFAAVVGALVSGVAVVGLPYLIRNYLGLSAQLYGAAESAAGLAALLGGMAAGTFAAKMPFRRINWLVTDLGVCVLLGGAAMAVLTGAMVQYAVLVVMFCAGQAAACTFSIFAVSAIQQKTPENMTGKVMACVSTISMCAQPLGQFAYGVWFDVSPGWLVLAASGIAVAVLGVISRKLFDKW